MTQSIEIAAPHQGEAALKSMADVGAALPTAHGGLRRAMSCAPQDAPHWQAEVLRQIVRLIEATVHGAPGVQGDGHHRVRPREHQGAGIAQKRCEGRCQRAASVVFEGVNNRAERTRVDTGAPGHFERGRFRKAARAHAKRTGG